MKHLNNRIALNLPLTAALVAGLAGCASAPLGRPPAMSEPAESAEFVAMTNPQIEVPVLPETGGGNASLWAGRSRSLIGDQRAQSRGDILTVVIEIDDKAEMSNSSGRSRTGAEDVSLNGLAGIPQRLAARLPDGASMDRLVATKSASTFKGTGNISRRDKVTLRVAATVIETLPNGVLHISGTQEVRVNFEMRVLTVSGFVRPQDIDRKNEIAYDRIAGARISYGGAGQITDAQQPRYGQQIVDRIAPF
ncbi:flagellar basal body L-ring protein FlgH [Paracoccus pacificus]|uniref:Flagellar L-ring protein n=1 Tax=Paracoccus pacificus TaxID=1463598 RepID=A0ABW4R9X6_9RHOB